jgi:hypothetical protein
MKTEFITIKNNNSYPWKANDKSEGLYSLLDLIPSAKKNFDSHHTYNFNGMRYQFHDPWEMPSKENRRFISKPQVIMTIEIDVDINELGENLVDYGVERFYKLTDHCLNLFLLNPQNSNF